MGHRCLGVGSRALGLVIALSLVLGGATWDRDAWAQEELFVSNTFDDSVTVHARTVTGNVGPIRSVEGAATGLSFPRGLFVDTLNGELVVVSSGNDAVLVYPLGANGNVAPLRTLQGPATGFLAPAGVFVDVVNDELVVTDVNANAISVFPRSADGNVAPVRKLVGAATGLGSPLGVAVDTVNGELLVANSLDAITVYPRTVTGNAAPIRTIEGPATGLETPRGAVVDTVNDELVVANGVNSVTVYPRTATGDTPPLRKLQGGASGLVNPGGLAVLSAGQPLANVFLNNDVYVVGSPLVYQATLSPGVAPIQVDLYLGFLLPDQATFVSLVQPSPGVLSASVGPAPVPFLSNVTLTQTIVDFGYDFTGIEPLGTYFAYAALVVAGGSPALPADHISVSARSFRFPL